MKKANVFEQNRNSVNNRIIGKVVGVSAAAVLALGIPTAIYAAKHSGTEIARADMSSYAVAENSATAAKAVNVNAEQSASKVSVNENKETKTEVRSEAETTNKKTAAKKTNKNKKKNKKNKKNNNNTVNTAPAPVLEAPKPAAPEAPKPAASAAPVLEAPKPAASVQAPQTGVQDYTPAPAAVNNDVVYDPETGYYGIYVDGSYINSDMSVHKMLTLNGAELRELSGNEFDIVPAAHTQGAYFGIRCKAFPEYVFVVNNDDFVEGTPSSPMEFPAAGDYVGWKYILGNRITQLDLYDGADVGNGVRVGMRYNDIEDILGTELYINPINTSLGYAAKVQIEGREWLLHFDLTDEQEQALYDEFSANYTGSGIGTDYSFDLSYLNPVCDIAVLDIR